MTAFQPTDLPSSINSVEKLAVWCSTVLNHLYPAATTIEAAGSASRSATAAPFFVTATDPPGWIHISRVSVQLNANWQRGTSDIWENAIDLGSASIPTEFKS